MKTYIANSVFLYDVEDRYRGHNGNAQFTIVARAKNQKRVAELIGCCSLSHLRNFYGIHEASGKHAGIPKKDDTIYYFVENTKNGYVNDWFEYSPK